MLDLRSADPHRAAADRRVAIVAGYGALTTATFLAVLAGAGGAAIWLGGTFALAGLPWLIAFNGRPYLAEDALAGVPFAWRGDRAGVWALAPPSGALLALLLVAALGLGPVAGLLLCVAGAAGHTYLVAFAERTHERAVLLELSVLEQRFERITDTRAAQAESRLVAARRAGVTPAAE
jgi:hypothetical protein